MQRFGLAFVVMILSSWLLPLSSAYSANGGSLQLAQMDHSHTDSMKMTGPNPTTATKKEGNAQPARVELKPAEGAKIKIVSPTKGQSFNGDKIPLEFALTKGKRGHHVHAYVDGELMGMFESAKGTLNGIKPGKHVLELRVVASDHQTELDARDTVEFTVK